MAKNNTGENPEFELVAPVKILVQPGFKGDGIRSSLRKRSIPSIDVPSRSHQSGSGHDESDNIFLVSQLEKQDRKKEASIRMQDGEKKNVAYYLQHCFRLMYFTGMSTGKFNSDKKDDTQEEFCMDTILNGLQKVIFWTITFLSLVFAILFAKINLLIFLWGGGVLRVVYVGSWLFAIVSEIYFIYLFVYRRKRIKETIKTLDNLGNYTIEEVEFGDKKWTCRNPHKLITVLFVATILACFIHPMGGTGVRGWTPKKLILDSSTQLSCQLFLWSPDDFDDNSTKVDELVQEYGTDLTTVTVIMGISEIGMKFCSNMKMDAAQNIGVVVAVLTWLRNRYMGRKVKNIDFESYTNGYDTDELENSTGLYAEFKQVKKENRLMNGLAGGLLKIVHAHNLLQCANFLLRCMDWNASLTEFAFLMYGMVKVAAIYYFGKKAETENEVFEEWIREWAMHSRDPVFLARVPAILDGMTKGPLGVGRGNFLVGQGFIFRFIGFVGSIFMLEVDDDDDEEN